jgi:hypothetical protein
LRIEIKQLINGSSRFFLKIGKLLKSLLKVYKINARISVLSVNCIKKFMIVAMGAYIPLVFSRISL